MIFINIYIIVENYLKSISLNNYDKLEKSCHFCENQNPGTYK